MKCVNTEATDKHYQEIEINQKDYDTMIKELRDLLYDDIQAIKESFDSVFESNGFNFNDSDFIEFVKENM